MSAVATQNTPTRSRRQAQRHHDGTPDKRERALVAPLSCGSGAKSEHGEALSTEKRKHVAKTWYERNEDLIGQADAVISTQLQNPKCIWNHSTPGMTRICDDVFNNILSKGLGSREGSENNSVLLLGESESGKTHVVEWCIKKLREGQPSTMVLRACGGAYKTDSECLRHLVSQLTQLSNRFVEVPGRGNTFRSGSLQSNMEWIRNVFRGSFKMGGAMVMVLDQFEHFCSKNRQTLLYNLFDVAQEVGVNLSIIGTSRKVDVMDLLEKRIRSRFSMRHMHNFLPTSMADLVHELKSRLSLPQDCHLKCPFFTEFHENLEAALWAKSEEWDRFLELGHSPSWFLWQCLPVCTLLQDAAGTNPLPAAKRTRLTSERLLNPVNLAITPECKVAFSMLESLSDTEHIVLIALHRLQERKEPRTLATLLHEIRLLHEATRYLTVTYDADMYSVQFSRLTQLGLVEFSSANTADSVKCHRPCQMCPGLADGLHSGLIRELGDSGSSPVTVQNPLRALPSPVQLWALRQLA